MAENIEDKLKELAEEVNQTSDGAEKGWYLKINTETKSEIYGPVPFKTLYLWGTECRLCPNHQVSQDKESWILAKDFKELEMEWEVDLIDGTVYGPLNKYALIELYEYGVIENKSKIRNVNSKETITMSQIRKLHQNDRKH
jgi:hypothetical protein